MEKIDDPTIRLFKKDELRPIKEMTAYHSPDLSESDNENPDKRNLVTKDLEWRSSTVGLADR